MKKKSFFLSVILFLCLMLQVFAQTSGSSGSSGSASSAASASPSDSAASGSSTSSDTTAASETPDEPIVISDMQMIVLPRDVFVGDAMEIRCTFSCDVTLLPTEVLSVEISPVEIQNLTVNNITLQRAGSSYMISMLCVPWSVGAIDIPPIVVSEHCVDFDSTVSLDIPEITVKSIVNYTGATELRAAKAPLLIPGTTWVIYLLSIVGIVLLVVIIVILIRFRTFRKKVRTVVSSLITVKSYHSLKYQMKRLTKSKKPVTDKQFASAVSHLIREYISCRFSYNFRSETPAGVVTEFERLSCGLFSVEAGVAIQSLSDVLVRCDYVRFSGDDGEAGTFPQEERQRICGEVINAAVCLEKDDRNAKV